MILEKKSSGANKTLKMMANILEKIKNIIKNHKEEIFLTLLITLCLLIGFGLGRLSKITERKTPITIEMTDKNDNLNKTGTYTEKYLASKNGTKYYLPWCDGVKKISTKNLVEFSSKEEAESAGYTKSSNCPGL